MGYPPPPPQSAPCAPGYGGSTAEPSEQRGSGGGLFSGKGLLGKAMKQAEKYGAGNMVGQAAGALGLGGGGQGGGHGGGSYGGGGQHGGGYQPQSAPGYPAEGGPGYPSCGYPSEEGGGYPGNYPPPPQ